MSRVGRGREVALRDRLHSIARDAAFVDEVREIYRLPVVANLRAGPWYCRAYDGTAYFKSTDGHYGAWQLSRTRLNVNVIHLAAARGGILLVDVTRRGRRLPDSFAKTVPIWATCWNMAVKQYRDSVAGDASAPLSVEWDTRLHTPTMISPSERQQIIDLLPGMVSTLLASTAIDWASISALLTRPLRPLWVTTSTRFFSGELPDPQTFSFVPIICVSASEPVDKQRQDDYLYMQGAADDEEAWARRLTARDFWTYREELLATRSAKECEQKVDAIVAAQEEIDAPVASVGEAEAGEHREGEGSAANASERTLSRLGSTLIFVGTRRAARPPESWSRFEAIINCTMDEYSQEGRPSHVHYMHMPVPEGKKARREMETQLGAAVAFARVHLAAGRRLLVHCNQGMDRSVTVAAAILIALFDPATEAMWPCEASASARTKADIMRWVQWISIHHPRAHPARSNIKRLHRFFLPVPEDDDDDD